MRHFSIFEITLGTKVSGSVHSSLSQIKLLTSFLHLYYFKYVGQHFCHWSQKDKINLWPKSAFPRHRDVPESHQRGYPRRGMRETHHHRRHGACPRSGLHFAQSKLLSDFSSHSSRRAYLFDRLLFAGHTLYIPNEQKKLCDRQRQPFKVNEIVWKLNEFLPSSTLTTPRRWICMMVMIPICVQWVEKIQLSVDLKRRQKLPSYPG